MRTFLLLSTAAFTLAACGGAGPQSAGGAAVVGTGTSPTGSTTTGTFVNPTDTKTYDGIGAVEHYEYGTRSDRTSQQGQLYAGDANTARDSGITVSYNPRDAIFELTINRPLGDVTTGTNRFQDPAHRTAFGGLKEPQASVPDLPASMGIQYLQSGSGTGVAAASPGNYDIGQDGYSSQVQTFFYQKPGTTTQYVTYAGYVRNKLSTTAQADTITDASGASTTVNYLQNTYSLDRAVFAYGERTVNSAVPTTGTGTYTGDMIATMVFNPLIDTSPSASTYFQWIFGTNTTTVDFGKLTVTTALNGTLTAPALDAYTNGNFLLAGGTTFAANGKGTIDLAGKGGFVGSFTDAKFTTPTGTAYVVSIAGSSLDGAFFGPAAQEVGGGFRIVGGTPDQRIDILGAYTGKK